MGPEQPVDLPDVTPATDLVRFKEKARAWLLAHADSLTLAQLRRNQQLTPTDLDTLETMLVDAGVGTPEDVRRAGEESHGLGLFVRSLVGLDRAAASKAFANYLRDRTFTAQQLDVVNLIIDHLAATGIVEASRLYESPFTDRAPTGPDFLFSGEDVNGIIVILDDIRGRALASPDAFGTESAAL